MFRTHTYVGRDNVSKIMMEVEFRNMLGQFDGEDEDENCLGYILFIDCLILHENEDETSVEI